jgi:uncharacterized protein (DUF488 family)
MSDYEEVLDQACKLSLVDQARLLEELAKLVRARIQVRPEHSVMEFRGVAKDFWQGIDVKQYVEEERNSWDRE